MEAINQFFRDNPFLGQVGHLILLSAITLVVVVLILRAQNRITAKLRKGKASLNARLVDNGFKFLLIFLAVQFVMMSSELTKNFGQTLFQGTAVLAAIAGFAAQNVLADILCGLIISTTKPFEIGNRISLESGISGIVVDMTLRHVVLRGIDTQMYVVPNSKMNAEKITNLSWQTETRSVDFRFLVAYTSDPDRARAVIRQAVMDSPLSVPGKPGKDGKEYADVYFLSMEEYSLQMGTTAYYMPGTPTEVFRTDINTRVKNALASNGIEIPYRYINVQMKDGSGAEF